VGSAASIFEMYPGDASLSCLPCGSFLLSNSIVRQRRLIVRIDSSGPCGFFCARGRDGGAALGRHDLCFLMGFVVAGAYAGAIRQGRDLN